MTRRKNKAGNQRSMERKPKTGSAKDVPFERCYEEAGMIEVKKGCFTHGYEIAAPMKPKEMTYSAKKVRAGMRKVFALFGDMSFQFVMRNHLIDTAEYLKRIQVQVGRYKQGDGADSRTGVPGDGIGRWIGAYNRMLEENADIGHNNYESRVYLTVTIECDYAAEAEERFGELDGRVADAFKELYGYEARPLSIRERLCLLYEMYHPGSEGGKEIFSEKRRLRNPREMVAPERVVYEKSQILLGKKYVRMFFMNLMPSEIPESLLCDLMAVSGNSAISVCYSPVDAKLGHETAERLVDENTKKETVAIRATVADRRAGRSEVIKQPKSENEETYFHTAALSLFDGAVEDGTDVLLTTMVISLICDSNDELERNSVLLRLAAYKYGCQLRVCDLMQRKAFQSVLPLNHVRVNYGRVFPSKRIAAVLPVNVQGLFETRPMFQGLNVINDNFVFADRRSCPVGLITGTAHSGKTFAVKRDAMNTLLMTEDSVFILTKRPDEYRGFMEAVDGGEADFTTDPFCKDKDYALNGDAGMLGRLFLSACMTMNEGFYRKKYLTAEKDMIRDKIEQEAEMLMYQGFDTLEDARAYAEDKREAFPYFLSAFGGAGIGTGENFRRLNVLPCKNDTVMLMMLDFLWNYAVAERKRNRNIAIYVDGADEFLYSAACSDYLLSVMDMAAKMQVALTLVLDDPVHIVTDQDAAIEADYFVRKVSFFKFLSMGPIERKWFVERLNINQTLIPYMADREPGEGVLITPTLNVAFTDHFDDGDSAFYEVFLAGGSGDG